MSRRAFVQAGPFGKSSSQRRLKHEALHWHDGYIKKLALSIIFGYSWSSYELLSLYIHHLLLFHVNRSSAALSSSISLWTTAVFQIHLMILWQLSHASISASMISLSLSLYLSISLMQGLCNSSANDIPPLLARLFATTCLCHNKSWLWINDVLSGWRPRKGKTL